MNLSYSLVPCKSFVKNFIRRYFTTNEIIKGFCLALFLSNFIFVSYFENLVFEFISPFLVIFALFILIRSNRFEFFHTGFFIGIFWFYWVSFSLRFAQASYLIPFEILIFGVIYGLIFLAIGWFKSVYIRAILLLGVSYFYPLNFNWLNLELTLIYGIFEPNLRGLGAILLSIIVFIKIAKFRVLLSLLVLFLGLQIKECEVNYIPLKTKLITTNIPQSIKWQKDMVMPQVKDVLKQSQIAINEGYEFVIFPESAITTYLNLDENLVEILKNISNKITILLGSTAYEDGKQYNSSYLFQNGKMSRFDKHVLVPVGEEIPLPNLVKNFINDTFFDGGTDFSKASSYSEFEISGVKIRNAICYEATRPEIYKKNPNIMVAISNNGWFVPSTEPNFQSLFIRYFATKHCTTVYHSVNASKSEIIKPKRAWIKKVVKKFSTKA
ncbi:apolipoprotein N-acyltransferase [Campylobacter corcagiensis]|uniref:Apolipoprotein N-acyltransferase n=1 Tax=Campylobacter corcagiensis TaxID=1448857 RepID=A0A7M1LG25_9BACT|nr:apolipoprotein N-acyltransferase [Campylobacter corcagiensis]